MMSLRYCTVLCLVAVVAASQGFYSNKFVIHIPFTLCQSSKHFVYTQNFGALENEIIQLSIKNDFGMILKSDGKVYAFGEGKFGKLGQGMNDQKNRNIPVLVKSTHNVDIALVSAGYSHTVLVDKTGFNAFGFGLNEHGAICDGTNKTAFLPSPIKKIQNLNFQKVESGGGFTLFLATDGKLYGCGKNINGELGTKSTISTTSMVISAEDHLFVDISAGFSHTLALKSSGELYSWGLGNFNGHSSSDITIPTKLDLFQQQVKRISSGAFHSFVLLKNSSIFNFGKNSDGQLCHENTKSSVTPTLLPWSGDIITNIKAGFSTAAFMTENSQIFFCGLKNCEGMTSPNIAPGLIVSSVEIGLDAYVKVTPALSYNDESVGLLSTTCFGIDASNSSVCSGNGECFATDNCVCKYPFITGNQCQTNGRFKTPLKVELAQDYTVILFTDGTVKTAGKSTNGALCSGLEQSNNFTDANFSSSVVIADVSSTEHNLFLDNLGRVWSCGKNSHGQLGVGDINGDRNNSYYPIQIPGYEGVTRICAGDKHSMFIHNGYVYSFGYTYSGTGKSYPNFYYLTTPNQVTHSSGLAVEIFSMNYNANGYMRLNGDIYTFGKGSDKQLCIDGATTARPTPELSVSGASQVFGGQLNIFYVKNDILYACGKENVLGQFGLNLTTTTTTDFGIPVVPQLSNIKKVVGHTGAYHTFVSLYDGSVYAFGKNTDGQLGFNDTETRTLATYLGNFTDSTFFAGAKTSAFIQSGELYMFGSNANYELGTGDNVARWVPTSVKFLECGKGQTGEYCEFSDCFGINSTDPTACSSHGVCTSYDNCTCNAGYTGIQCELFICYGKSSSDSNVCSGHGTCLDVNNCTCATGYSGIQCEFIECFGKNSTDNNNVCSAHGSCNLYNNCSCFAGYTGIQCEFTECYGKNSTESDVCSGNGSCDTFNNCTCNTGYSGNQCEFIDCYGKNSTDSSVCSSHGSCSSFNNCTCNIGYSGNQCEFPQCFGKNSTESSVCTGNGLCNLFNNCTCDFGYSGIQCEFIECYGMNSTNSNVCTGHGSCASFNNCTCNMGYSGNRCEFSDCYGKNSTDSAVCSGNGNCVSFNNCTCNIGYSGNQCEFSDCYGKNSSDTHSCSSRGSCISYNNCTCVAGYTGNQCEFSECFGKNSTEFAVCSGHGSCFSFNNCTCNLGYSGNQCEFIDCYGKNSTDPSRCSSHGSCSSFNNCTCSLGYSGTECEFSQCYEKNSTDPSVCSGKGTCNSFNNCTCDTFHTGIQCEFTTCFGKNETNAIVCSGRGTCDELNNCTCYMGYSGSECDVSDCFGVNSSNSNVCSGNGNCIAFNNCSCKTGYSGMECEFTECFGKNSTDPSTCSHHGSCGSLNNCSCEHGYSGIQCEFIECHGRNSTDSSVCFGRGSCSSYNNCSCEEGYSGMQCEFTECYGINSTDFNVCSKKGSCEQFNNCTCISGYSGIQCEFIECYGKNSTESVVCSGNGNCASFNNCTCNVGYSGNQCEFIDCYGKNSSKSTICSSRGSCSSFNNCTCNLGYSGTECEFSQCYGKNSTDPSVCSQHGNCVSFNNCTCNLGYSGNQCEFIDCYGKNSTDSSVCSSHGSCSSFNNCTCNLGYSGNQCEFSQCYEKNSTDPSVCSGKGTCNSFNNCTCDTFHTGIQCEFTTCFGKNETNAIVCSGRGTCDELNNCSCNSGYSGMQCEFSECFGVNSTDNNVCSGHGNCVSFNNCTCNSHHTGNECQLNVCYGKNSSYINVCSSKGYCQNNGECLCQIGFTDNECQTPICFGIAAKNTSVCSKFGNCVSNDTCSCNKGYTGLQCEIPPPFTCFGKLPNHPQVCSGRGICYSPDKCNCSLNYYGPQCETYNCFDEPFGNVRVCSGVGVCKNPNECQCNTGYIGDRCEFALCFGKNSSNPSVCSGNGICSGLNRCICRNQFNGDECQFKNETVTTITPDCVVFKDNFIRYYQSKKSFVIEPNICSKQGWSGIAVHQQPGIQSAMFLAVSWFDGSILNLGELGNHQSKRLKLLPTIGLLLPTKNDTPPQLQFLQKQRFIIEIDQILLSKFNYISIVCSDGATNVSNTFPYHTFVSTNRYNLSNTKSVCDVLSLTGYSKSLADNSFVYWFFEMSAYVVLFIVAVSLRDFQPLRSRGFIPYLALLAQYGACLSSIQHFFFDLETRSKYSCVLQGLLHENFVTTIFSIMPINYFRYILLINMNKQKENVSIDGKRKSFHFRLILFMKSLSTPMSSFLLLSFVWIFVSSIDILFIATIPPQLSCETFKSYGLYTVHLLFNIAFGIIFFAIGIFDVITNLVRYITKTKKSFYRKNAWIKRLWEHIIDFYLDSDPFFFRGEQLIAFGAFCIYILVQILNYNVLIFGSENAYHYYFGQYFLPVAISFVGYAFAFYQAFIPLIGTMISLIIKKIKKPSNIESTWDMLTEALKDEEMFDLLMTFSGTEWSQENVLAYRDIEEYKKLRGKEKRENHAFNIYYTYLNGPNSPLELNIDMKSRKEVFEVINDENCKFSDEIFEKVEKTVRMNLSDTWSRFFLTTQYANFAKNKELQSSEMSLL